MKGLAVFISGSGSNLQAIIEACRSGDLPAEIKLVVSNRKAAYGLERARQANIPTLYFPLKPYTDSGQPRALYDADLAQAVRPFQPDLIVLAGFMHIFTPAFLDIFPHTINLHPALPGMFPGAHAIEDTFAAFQQGGISHSGCMVHVVTPELDAGPVIDTEIVPIQKEDTLETFKTRMHRTEHRLLIRAIKATLTRLSQSM